VDAKTVSWSKKILRLFIVDGQLISKLQHDLDSIELVPERSWNVFA